MTDGRPTLPDGLTVVRTTPEFGATTMPEGLRRSHQVAEGTWGRLRVLAGQVHFVFEAPQEAAFVLGPGDELAIPPHRLHHVEPADDARFVVDFLR